MRWMQVGWLLTAGVSFAFPHLIHGQDSGVDVVGVVREDGIAVPKLAWDGIAWARVWAGLDGVGASWTLVDSAGRSAPLNPGAVVPLNGMYDRIGYQTDLPDPVLETTGYPVKRLGYFVSTAEGDAPFQVTESVEGVDWGRFLSDHSPPTDNQPQELNVQLWTATLEAKSVTFFRIRRQARALRGCPPLFVFEGWVLGPGEDPVVSIETVGDCDGKGAEFRYPWTLLTRGGDLYAFLSLGGWESETAEAWHLVDGRASVVQMPR